MLLWIQFLVGARGDFPHRHERAGLDVGGGVFPRLADIDEAGLVFAKQGDGIGRGDFEFEHIHSLFGAGAGAAEMNRASYSACRLNELADRYPPVGLSLDRTLDWRFAAMAATTASRPVRNVPGQRDFTTSG